MIEHRAASAEEAINFLFAVIHGGRVAEARVDAVLATVGLSSQRWFALRRLDEAGGSLSLGQAAERLACAKSNVTQLVDRLEREGLVARVPDPLDRRSIFAQLTEEGRHRYRAGWRALQELGELLAAKIPAPERDELARGLGRLDPGASDADH